MEVKLETAQVVKCAVCKWGKDSDPKDLERGYPYICTIQTRVKGKEAYCSEGVLDNSRVLKRCPFCGSEARIQTIDDDGFHEAWAICCKCFCKTETFYKGDTEKLAIEQWNKRVNPIADLKIDPITLNYLYRMERVILLPAYLDEQKHMLEDRIKKVQGLIDEAFDELKK